MKCISPVCLQDPGTGGVMSVPCGRCMPCRVNRTQEWSVRILHESKLHDFNIFVTLTYSDEFLPENGSLCKSDLQLFFKRLRKYKSFRYYACGEYGENYFRPHYHIIFFGISPNDRRIIERCWSKGIVHVGMLTEQSARYCAKYVQKQLFGPSVAKYEGRDREFSLMSRKPGIGFKFAKMYVDNWLQKGYLIVNGSKRPIPRGYIYKMDDAVLHKLHDLRSQQKMEVIDRVERETGVNVYGQIDSEISERSQRDLNLRTRIGMQKSKL
nr:MAG: replication initiator protein [Microviridae sp.]